MPTEPHTDPLRDIQVNIGRFVMCCTSLEWLAFEAIHQLEPDAAKAATLADQEVQRRVVALLELSRRNLTGETKAEWVRLWEQVCSLLQKRREILHNPLLFQIWENDRGDHAIIASIHPFRGRSPPIRPLTPASIREAADKAQRYALDAPALVSVLWRCITVSAQRLSAALWRIRRITKTPPEVGALVHV